MQRCSYATIRVRTLAIALALVALVFVVGTSGNVVAAANGTDRSATPKMGTTTAVQPGFSESVVFSGLTEPTAVRFSPDGRVFVAEKSGLIKVFDSVRDKTPTVFADLRTQVYNFDDRGLLGIALDPD